MSPRGIDVTDFYTTVEDGTSIIVCFETVVGIPMKERYNRMPSNKFHKLQNAELALKFLEKEARISVSDYHPERLIFPNKFC